MTTPSVGPFALALALTPLFACSGSDKDASTDSSDTADTAVDTQEPDDSGDTAEVVPVWTSYRIETSSTLQGVYASGQGVYVVGTDGKAWVGGATTPWSGIDPAVDGQPLTDLWGQGAGDTMTMVATAASGFVATWSGGGWRTSDVGTANLEGVGASAPDAIFAASWGGVYRWDGAAWNFERLPGDERINDIFAIGTDAVGVGEAGAIVRRSGTESAWSAMDNGGLRADLQAVSGTALNDVWAVGADGVAVHWDGAAWTQVDTGVDVTLWGVFAAASDAVFVVGNNGIALRWNGTAFESLPTGVDNNLYAVHGVSGSNVWAVGNRGATIQFKE